MDLRAKLAAIFLLLLVLPFVTISAIQIDRTAAVMIGDLADSGDLLINQSFEQVRRILTRANGDPIAAMRSDPALATLLESSQAFGKGVVYAQIETLSGAPIIAPQGDPPPVTVAATPPFADLRAALASWWPPTRFEAIAGNHTYEISRAININGQPLAVIRVGLSTALIAAEARRSVRDILAAGAAGVVLSLLGAMVAGGLMMRPLADLATRVERIAEGADADALPVESGDELGTLAAKFNELSRRIKATRAQWETERGQFINIFRSINDAVILLDASGSVLFVNPEAQERLGLPAGGVAEGKPLPLLLGRDHPLSRLIETAYATGTEMRDVALDLGPDGQPSRLLVSISSLGQSPEPAGLLIVARDLESMRELENVVDYSGRLVRLGGLISGVAHQIRNPLNAMNLQLELLSQDAGRGAPLDQRLGAVRREIDRLSRAIDALMRFMRPEELKLAPVAINELIGEAASQVTPSGIRIESNFDRALPIVNVDRALLGEALRNVISNACDAMAPKGGTLRLATALAPGGFVEIRIADTGGGIEPENLERIFNLYFTTKQNGNGLGLPLALRAVDLHHGTMEIQSEPGAGTTVIIRIPASRRTDAAIAPPARAG